jgi:hypothetical protein
MSLPFKKILAIAFPVLLALPPGWCCILVSVAEAAKAPNMASQQCRSCCTRHSEAQPAKKHAPPSPASRCPCAERLNFERPAATVKKVDLSPGDVAVFSLPSFMPVCQTSNVPANVPTLVPSCQIHISNCVWLC